MRLTSCIRGPAGGEEVDSFEHLRAANTVVQNAYVDLTITCGAQVRRLADSYHAKLYELRPAAQAAEKDSWSSLNEDQRQARKDLRDAMRAELGVLD
jgi:predicted nuclease of restriction endonuclease-like (RecB) superfamily